MNAPLIVAVNGVAAGAGFSFVGFADMAIASSNATFVSAYSKIGLTPDGSSTYFLPRIIGTRRYTELVLTNRVLSAKEALDWGLINKVVDFNDLKDEAYNLDPETIYFITHLLNQNDLKTIRNEILTSALPQRS